MATYYVDFEQGDDRFDGLSPASPKKTQVCLRPGDTELFRRGTVFHGMLQTVNGTPSSPVTYGAYGEGELPVFSGAIERSDPADWEEEAPHLWKCTRPFDDETGNVIYDRSDRCGALKWSKEELCEQGDFYDTCFGYRQRREPIGGEHALYLYSEGNPGDYYSRIECAVYGQRRLANNCHDMILRDLKFYASGVHAVAGEEESRRIRILNCEFSMIGGCVWNADRRIRFGNGAEFWNIAEEIEISGCTFDQIYDSAVTHQGGEDCTPAYRLRICGNRFLRCGMGAYELRDRMPRDSAFCDNFCDRAGEGFSHLCDLPRNSEIYPQPMGHHLFLWRVEAPTPGGGLEISGNVFGAARHGAAIYSLISPEADRQLSVHDNRCVGEKLMLYYRNGAAVTDPEQCR